MTTIYILSRVFKDSEDQIIDISFNKKILQRKLRKEASSQIKVLFDDKEIIERLQESLATATDSWSDDDELTPISYIIQAIPFSPNKEQLSTKLALCANLLESAKKSNAAPFSSPCPSSTENIIKNGVNMALTHIYAAIVALRDILKNTK